MKPKTANKISENIDLVSNPPKIESVAFEISTLSMPRQESMIEFRTKDSHNPASLEASNPGPAWTSRIDPKIQSMNSNKSTICKLCTKKFTDLRKLSNDYLYVAYEGKTQKTYNVNIVNDIVFNAQTHIVAVFKDYLIFDDIIEFLKKSYESNEVRDRLKKACDFYEKYSKVFPNYISLKEKKYMFKNIERKQKMIDEKQRALQKEKNNGDDENKEKNMLTKNFMKDLSKTASQLQTTKVKKMGVQELLEKYINNDSLSLIANTRCEEIEASFIPAPKSAAKATPRQVPPLADPSSMTKIENIRKKSVEAHTTVAAVKKMHNFGPTVTSNLNTNQNAGTLNGMIFMQVPIMDMEKVRKPEQKQIHRNINWKLAVPQRKTSMGRGQVTPSNLNNNNNNPLNININLNLVVNSNSSNTPHIQKGGSRTGTPQTCTAANLRRYKSLERMGHEKITIDNTRTIPMPGTILQPPKIQKRVILHRPSNSNGVLLKSRQEKSRVTATQRVYGNPTIIPSRKSVPRIFVKSGRGDDLSMQTISTMKNYGKRQANAFLSPNVAIRKPIVLPNSPRTTSKIGEQNSPAAKFTTKAMIVRGNDGRGNFSGSIIGNPFDYKKPAYHHK